MTTHSNPQAGWYADPHANPDLLRWWDGARWTEHTRAAPQPEPPARPQTQPRPPHAHVPAQQWQSPAPADPVARSLGQMNAADVQRQVQHQAGVGPTAGGGGTLFTEPILVVNQKAKLIETNSEYSVYDQTGRQIGSVAEVGQSVAKKAVRALTRYGQFMSHRLEVRDAYGQPLLFLLRPAKFLKSRMIVTRADGVEVGHIVQQKVIGRITFGFEVGGRQIGAIKAENLRAWNFAIVDHTDTETARITKTWEGLGKAMFTSADNYVLQIHRPLAEPLLSMVLASALTVDTALKQDNPSLLR